MEVILTIMFVMLMLLIFYLANKIQTDRKKFKIRLKVLEGFIVDLSENQENQNQKLQLSQELRERLSQITTDLNQNVFDLNYHLFEEIYQKRNY